MVEPLTPTLTCTVGFRTVYVTPAIVTVTLPKVTFEVECRLFPTFVTSPVTVAEIPVGTPEGEVWVIVNVNVSELAVPTAVVLKIPRLTLFVWPTTAHPVAQSVAPKKLIPVSLVDVPVEPNVPDVVNETLPADAKADRTNTKAAIRIPLFFTLVSS